MKILSCIIFCFVIAVTNCDDIQKKDVIKVVSRQTQEQVVLDNFDAPDSLDWREKGVILPVTNQGECGDAVLLNALDSLSAAVSIQTGKILQQLSQQQLYDCSQNPQWCSCEGTSTNVSDVYNYLIKSFNGDVDSEVTYPTTGTCDKVCHFAKAGAVAQIEQYAENISGDEQILLKEVQYGPVSAAINAGLASFQIYTNGIYEDPDCNAQDIDHVVLIVGYGTQDGTDYWIARNTWGENWGEKGYIRIARNKNNMCGVASFNTIPWRVNSYE